MSNTRVPKAAAAPGGALETVKPVGALSSFDPATAFAGAPPQGSRFLSAFKIPYAIEMGANGIEAAHVYMPGLYDGTKFEPIVGDYLLVALATRNCARRLVAGSGGQKTYNRAYAALQSYSKSAEAYEAMAREAANDPGTELGVSYLLAILTKDAEGKIASTIIQLDSHKVMVDYMGKPLLQARLPNRMAAKCPVFNHSVNLTEGKADPTRKYLDPRKHTQWKLVDLTPEDLAAVSAAWDDNKKGVDGWLNK